MTRRRGFALGIGITMMAAYAVAAIGFFQFAPPLLHASSNPESLAAAPPGYGFRAAIVEAAGGALVIAALQIVCMVQACRSRQLSGSGKAGWVMALLLGSVVVMPFFWYLHVWRPAGQVAVGEQTGEQRFAALPKRRSREQAPTPPPMRGTA